MTYLLICLPFVAVAVVLAAFVTRRMPARERRRRWAATAIGAVVLLILTAAFDSLMIVVGLFGYTEATRVGLTIGRAPIEDFAYPIAAVLLVPAVFTLTRRLRRRRARAED